MYAVNDESKAGVEALCRLDSVTLYQDGRRRPEVKRTNFAEEKLFQVVWFVRKTFFYLENIKDSVKLTIGIMLESKFPKSA